MKRVYVLVRENPDHTTEAVIFIEDKDKKGRDTLKECLEINGVCEDNEIELAINVLFNSGSVLDGTFSWTLVEDDI